MSSRYLALVAASRRLGIRQVARVAGHRLKVRFGWYRRVLPTQERSALPLGPFFVGKEGRGLAYEPLAASQRARLERRLAELEMGRFQVFGEVLVLGNAAPTWAFDGYERFRDLHFSEVPINFLPGHDVKRCWDLSRWRWLVDLSLAHRSGRRGQEVSDIPARTEPLALMNSLVESWLQENGLYRGVNWACGQEAAVRGLHFMLACALVGDVETPPPAATALIRALAKRVDVSIAYANGQQNNHTIVENAFLACADAWLADAAGGSINTRRPGKAMAALDRACHRLFLPDGGFAMYSINYHRSVLDILAIVELLLEVRGTGVPTRTRVAVERGLRFLEAVVDRCSGRAPNIGVNDGTLYCPQLAPFDDYRPTLVHVASAFDVPLARSWHRAGLDTIVWRPLRALGDHRPKASTIETHLFDSFGLFVFRSANYWGCVKYPRAQFRPGQADFLHLDLWIDGDDVFCDAGTYSYNPPVDLGDQFDTQSAHNTVQVDGHDFVVRLSRFMLWPWPNGQVFLERMTGSARFRVSVAYPHGRWHEREVHIGVDSLIVRDSTSGVQRFMQVRLRGRELPALSGATAHYSWGSVVLEQSGVGSQPVLSCEPARFSRRYLDIEHGHGLLAWVEAAGAACLITRIKPRPVRSTSPKTQSFN